MLSHEDISNYVLIGLYVITGDEKMADVMAACVFEIVEVLGGLKLVRCIAHEVKVHLIETHSPLRAFSLIPALLLPFAHVALQPAHIGLEHRRQSVELGVRQMDTAIVGVKDGEVLLTIIDCLVIVQEGLDFYHPCVILDGKPLGLRVV